MLIQCDWRDCHKYHIGHASSSKNLHISPYFAETEMVSAESAVGRISADLIAPYPPGVAVVAPGELLTQQIVEGLSASRAAGVRIAYATDSTLNSYRVVKQTS